MPDKTRKKFSLSIVTITYNDTVGLQKTLRSLGPLLTSEIPWEHVIVDSSPNLSGDVLAGLPETWPLIRVESSPQGIYPAMNLGLTKCHQEIVWFLNSGDELASLEGLSSLLRVFENSRIDGVYAGCALYVKNIFQYSLSPDGNILNYLLGMNRICHQGVLYKRDLFVKSGAYLEKYKLAADYEFNFRVYLGGAKLVCKPEIFVNYDNSGLSSNYRKAMEEFKQVHLEISGRAPFKINFLNRVLWNIYFAKIILSKTLHLRRLKLYFTK